MSQLNAGPVFTSPSQIRPGADLYTVLLILATVLLAAGTIFVAVRSHALFETWLPPAGG